MRTLTVAVLGIGNLRCGPPVLASIASIGRQANLDIRLYDSDDERLDLFDRLARVLFMVAEVDCRLSATTVVTEALEDADLAILCAGRNCASRELAPRPRKKPFGAKFPRPDELVVEFRDDDPDSLIERWTNRVLGDVGPERPLLSLMPAVERSLGPSAMQIPWPDRLREEDRKTLPHQILRWVRGDDIVQPLLERYERSPVTGWLLSQE